MSKYPNETLVTCPDRDGHQYWANFAFRSLGKGRRKKVYKGILQGIGPKKDQKVVVKVFQSHEGTESDCDAEISRHLVARDVTIHFNRYLHNRIISPCTFAVFTPEFDPHRSDDNPADRNNPTENYTDRSNVESRDITSSQNATTSLSSRSSVDMVCGASSTSGSEKPGGISLDGSVSSSSEKQTFSSKTIPVPPQRELSSPSDKENGYNRLERKESETTRLLVVDEATDLIIPSGTSEERKEDLVNLNCQGIPQVVRVVVPAKVTLEVITPTGCVSRGKRQLTVGEWALLESRLDQPFADFLSSEGLLANDKGSKSAEGFSVNNRAKKSSSFSLPPKRSHAILEAFVHFSYQCSQRTLVVCGLQGSRNGEEYLLTAPVLHSAARSFGETDLGRAGMGQVMKNHVCNGLCKDFVKYVPDEF